ncbi:MAG: DUF2213 domain-containing protein [Sulfuricella sp.]
MKQRTNDRSRFYAPNAIGDKRSTTPEGFLVCHDVPIARTGTQLYTAEEIPIDPGPDGFIRIERIAEEVFRDETLASFEGKAVTVEHPEDFVTPDNWRTLSIGTVQNVRRGDGIDDDLLIADLVITDPDGIRYVNKDLPEVSAGYEAEYEQTGPGRGLQRGIVGNHVALVDRGRAGPRCSIQDKETVMKTKDKESLLSRLMKAIKTGDADEIKATMADADEEETPEEKAKREAAEKEKKTTDSIAKLTATVDALAAVVSKLATKDANGDEDDEKKKTDDEDEGKEKTADEILEAETAESNKEAKGTVLSGDTMKQLIARAEILAPGIAVPTGDALKATDAAERIQRKALDTAYGTETGKAAIEPFLMGREIKSLTGDALGAVFAGSSELIRAQNNLLGARNGVSTKDFGRATSVEDINARNREFWARKN